MSSRLLLLIALTPWLASAQLVLSVFDKGVEKAVSGLFDIGSVEVGESIDSRFRIRNAGQASVTLQSVIASGTGFRATNLPAIPYIVAPGTNVDFTVRFSPANFGSYSASLAINSSSILLRGVALAGVLVSVNGTQLASGAAVDFGLVERGQSSLQRFTLKNSTSVAVVVTSIAVSGAAYRMPTAASGQTQLAVNAEIGFDVAFEPKAAGIALGLLTIDGRSYSLTGSGKEPPFPRPAVVLESGALTSGKQGRLSVRFAGSSRAAGTGVLRIELQPVPGTVDNDAALQFLSNSSRTIPFQVVEGSNEAAFGSSSQIVFQTGTTAGTLVFTAEVGGFREQLTTVVPPSAVSIETATAVRSGSMLDVQVAGWDNTRSVGQMTFTFYNTSGQPLGSPIKADAVSDFRKYFEGSKLGGLFALKASFPVTGNIGDIAGVEVQMQNSSGTVVTQRLKF